MTLKEEMKEILGIKKMQEISKDRLHPPMAPVGVAWLDDTKEGWERANKDWDKIEPIMSEKSAGVKEGRPPCDPPITDSKLAIDFKNMPKTYWRWCDRLETKRTWYHARFDKVHRGSVEKLKKDVEEREVELDVIALMKKSNTPAFVGVMQEFKSKVAKLQEKRVE